jgi:hypothetical protein
MQPNTLPAPTGQATSPQPAVDTAALAAKLGVTLADIEAGLALARCGDAALIAAVIEGELTLAAALAQLAHRKGRRP